MHRSKIEIYLHFVWATHRRLPLITPLLEPELYQVLTEQANHMGCQVLALGGVSDHVHVVVCTSSKYAPFEIAKQLKGASSAGYAAISDRISRCRRSRSAGRIIMRVLVSAERT